MFLSLLMMITIFPSTPLKPTILVSELGTKVRETTTGLPGGTDMSYVDSLNRIFLKSVSA